MTPDPGWRPVFRNAHLALVPHLALYAAPRRQLDGLTVLRLVVSSFWVAILLALLVVTGIDPQPTTGMSVALAVLLVMALAAWGYGGAAVLVGRARVPDDALAAAAEFRTRSFLIVGLTTAAPLLGFVFAFMTGSLTPMVTGLVLSIPGLIWALPTASRLERRQDELAGVDLIGALMKFGTGGS